MIACPVCAESGSLLKTEQRDGDVYRAYKCRGCRSIWCPDHYASVSPDYVNRKDEDITPEVIWLQGVHKQSAFDQLFKKLEKSGRGVDSLLDVGCGTGGFLSYAKSRGVRDLYGFDAAEVQVQVAGKVSPHVRHCISAPDYVEVLGRAPHWDLITLWDVIEHVREPNSLLAGLRQHCSPDTLVFFSTPNGNSEFIKLHLRRAFSVTHSFIPWEHVLYYSPKGIELMLEKNGFQVVCCTGTVCYPRPLSAFELVRRAAFATVRRTPLAPQLFVLARKAN